MKKASDLLNYFFDDIQKKQGEQYIDFYKSWVNIAGDKIGKNSKINDVIDGNLIVEIDHPGWKQLILAKEKMIIKQINVKFPELNVKKIKFYFTTNITKPNIVNESRSIEGIKKPLENIDINSDFLSLLKKMDKRSEE